MAFIREQAIEAIILACQGRGQGRDVQTLQLSQVIVRNELDRIGKPKI
jgi:hypothetical protein